MKLKQKIKRLIPSNIFRLLRDFLYPEKINILEERMNGFFNTYHQNIASPQLNQKTAFKNAEYKIYSKHGCDGLLLYIFSKIGATNRTFVEIGIQDGRECNTANLSINFGWNGLLIEANKEWAEMARSYYKKVLGTNVNQVHVGECLVTAENINSFLDKNSMKGEIDLLSIDIDSNDYWVWEAITNINPRVVVIEYNASLGPTASITMKYDPTFQYQKFYRENPFYYGASVTALARLGTKKGYTLVTCDVNGGDTYFVRNDVCRGIFKEMSPEEAFYPNSYRLQAVGDTEAQYELIKSLDFEKIE